MIIVCLRTVQQKWNWRLQIKCRVYNVVMLRLSCVFKLGFLIKIYGDIMKTWCIIALSLRICNYLHLSRAFLFCQPLNGSR